MSLYVEIGFPTDAAVDVDGDARARARGSARERASITDHRLVAEHSVVMDPAYVHITQASIAEHAAARGASCERTACTPSAATAGGPTAPSRTTSSKRGLWLPSYELAARTSVGVAMPNRCACSRARLTRSLAVRPLARMPPMASMPART